MATAIRLVIPCETSVESGDTKYSRIEGGTWFKDTLDSEIPVWNVLMRSVESLTQSLQETASQGVIQVGVEVLQETQRLTSEPHMWVQESQPCRVQTFCMAPLVRVVQTSSLYLLHMSLEKSPLPSQVRQQVQQWLRATFSSSTASTIESLLDKTLQSKLPFQTEYDLLPRQPPRSEAEAKGPEQRRAPEKLGGSSLPGKPVVPSQSASKHPRAHSEQTAPFQYPKGVQTGCLQPPTLLRDAKVSGKTYREKGHHTHTKRTPPQYSLVDDENGP